MTTKHILYVALSFLMVALVSCNKVPIGYLDTRQAIFTPDTIYVSRTINPDSPRAKNGAPWTSLRIQGVAGTNPINYDFHSVKVNNGGDAAKFEAIVNSGLVLVDLRKTVQNGK